MPLPTFLTAIGIGKETTKGTGVVPADFIPIDASTVTFADKVTYFPDQALRGSQVDAYDEIAGLIWSELDFGGPVYADTFGYVLAGLLGDVVTTGASAPFSHVMAVKNSGDGQPVSYSISDFYGLGSGSPDHRYPGCQFSESAIKITADGLVTHASKLTGFQSVAVAKPASSYTQVSTFPTWRCGLTIAGTSKTFLMEAALTLKRNITPIPTAGGTQAPYAIWVGGLSVEGQATFVHEDDAELTRYLTNTQPSFVLDFQQGAGAALVELKLQMSRCAYIEGVVKRDKDWVSSMYKIKGLGNSTDVGASGGLSNIKATIQSAKPAATYA